jgi:hypothetical protein
MKQILLLIIAGIVVAGCCSTENGYTVTLKQIGSNVVANGCGAINLTGLTFAGPGLPASGVNPALGLINIGQPLVTVDEYAGFRGPMSFGSGGGGGSFANTASGDHVGMDPPGGVIDVPQGYVSGAALSDTMTFNNVTLASLGVTPGTYVWTWGTEANQNFTLIIGQIK